MKSCTFNHYVEVQGVVDGDQNVAVSPQTPGIVTKVYVREGSQVKKGQVLAELDAQVLKQSLDEVKTQLDLANNLFEKQKALWDKKIGSEVQFLQAKANKESLEKRSRTLQGQIDMAVITSPHHRNGRKCSVKSWSDGFSRCSYLCHSGHQYEHCENNSRCFRELCLQNKERKPCYGSFP